MNATALLRVSTEKQDVDAQRFVIGRWASANGVEVEYLDEGDVSGKFFEEKRPKLKQLMNDCRRGLIRTLVLTEYSRLGRKMLEVLVRVKELHDLGVRVVVLSEVQALDTSSPLGLAILGVLAAVDEEERLRTGRRVKAKLAAKKAAAAAGGPPSNIGNPGYQWTAADDAKLLELVGQGFTPADIEGERMLTLFRKRKVDEDGKLAAETKKPGTRWDWMQVVPSDSVIRARLALLRKQQPAA